MLRTLRDRLIFSHVMPLLIILPLMGLLLSYVLETRYLLPQIAQDLTGTARLLAKVAGNQPNIWLSPDSAQQMLRNTVPIESAQVMLLSPDSRLIASSLPVHENEIGSRIKFSRMDEVVEGETIQVTNYSPRSSEEAVDVYTPIQDSGGKVIGVVRLSYHAAIFYQEFSQFRGLIAGILLIALFIGAGIGYALALTISKPIMQVTKLVYGVAHGELREPQMEYGPEEVRLLLRAVNYLVERLNNLEQSRRQLLANLVHELGRPLGALRSAIQAIAHGAWKDPQLLQDLTQGMDEEAIRLQHLLEDLAHLHDQAQGLMELNLHPLSMSEWLPTILRPWEQAAAEKRQHWSTDIPKNIPIIEADSTRLAQVVGNLVSNAIKYTPINGTISIDSGQAEPTRDAGGQIAGEPENGWVWIRVSDSGPGVPREEQEKIFRPYYRGTQAQRIPQGMGLGLSIARDIVIAHDGKLEVESTPGLGSRFTVWLPR